MSRRAEKYSKVPYAHGCAQRGSARPPGSSVSRNGSPVVTAASERVVGMPSACIPVIYDFLQYRSEPRPPVAGTGKRAYAQSP